MYLWRTIENYPLNITQNPSLSVSLIIWTASSEFGTYSLCEQRRFRRACASAQSRQNLRCSLIQAVCQEEPSDRKPDPWPLWMAGHAQLKFVMTECSKTQIRLTGLIYDRMQKCLTFLDDGQGQDTEVGINNTTPDRLPFPFSLPTGTEAGVALTQEQLHTTCR